MIDLKQFEGHTPGPWEVVAAEFVDEDPRSVTYEVRTMYDPVISWPNARLIAAAPELLAQLAAKDAVIRDLKNALVVAYDYVSEVGDQQGWPSGMKADTRLIDAALALAAPKEEKNEQS